LNLSNTVFTIYTSDGYNDYQGLGFFISSDGLAVSNYHVFRGTDKELTQIKMADGSVSGVSNIVAYDADDEIFIFKVKSKGKLQAYDANIKTQSISWRKSICNREPQRIKKYIFIWRNFPTSRWVYTN